MRSIGDILDALRAYRFMAVDEAEIQNQIAAVLVREGVSFTREFSLGPAAGRIDFLLDAGVGIEVKVQGSPSSVIRQLFRYAKTDTIRQLVLVSRRAQHRSIRGPIAGKPLHVVHLTGGLL